MNFDALTNLYPKSKTLRFRLIPYGETERYFDERRLLEEDEVRSRNYEKVKGYMDRYYKRFNESVLDPLVLTGVSDYAELYFNKNKDETDLAAMKSAEDDLRKQISKALTSGSAYQVLFGKEMIEDNLPAFDELSEEEKEDIRTFEKFSTYFRGFFDNRKNMYSEADDTCTIAHRCVADNLPRFLDNCKNYQKIREVIPEKIEVLNRELVGLVGKETDELFDAEFFSYVLSQRGIDRYNTFLGGYTTETGDKIPGLNQYINEFNQQIAKKDKTLRLPFLKQLYKQILSDRVQVSYLPEKFLSDDEVKIALRSAWNEGMEKIPALKETARKTADLLASLPDTDLGGVFVTPGPALTSLSQVCFRSWSAVSDAWGKEYEAAHPHKAGANLEKYEEKKRTAFKNTPFSLEMVQRYGDAYVTEEEKKNVAAYLAEEANRLFDACEEKYEKAEEVLSSGEEMKRLALCDDKVEKIKDFLDAVKALEAHAKLILGTGKEAEKNDVFYGEFLPIWDDLTSVDRLYDKVRNYLTQKPFSTEKIKLNFGNPQLLGGWDMNKESAYRTVLLRKDGNYYLGITEKGNNGLLDDTPADGECFEKMEYKVLPGPNKMLPKVFFSEKNIEYFAPSQEIMRIKEKATFTKGAAFNLSDCHKMIDFYKGAISKHKDWSKFGFSFKPTEEYRDIGEFYWDITEQGYSVSFRKISSEYIDACVREGKLYLFQLYNKDFSDASHGTPNLHTLYFKALFDENNLKETIYKLNGSAEMFYRKASIREKEKVIHPANCALTNKNGDNPKKQSVFAYDLIKDKRYTENRFMLHVPITMNFRAKGGEFVTNEIVRQSICEANETPYAIGIDRGERNLLFVSVVNGNGEIVEQKSLNIIESDNGYRFNYHRALSEKENARTGERKNWKTVESIKETKEGYLSQAVHQICEMVLRYHAVIVMEDLNGGFKHERAKIEKSVYQNFENMLIEKLNYLVDKKAPVYENGGLYHAYQMTNKTGKVFAGSQNGIVFYIPAYLTSKIDPTTGFVDLLHPKYESVEKAKDLLEKFDAIRYDTNEDLFVFDIDYSKFQRTEADFRKKWTIFSNGDRIRTYRKSSDKQWTNETVRLTDDFKRLFLENGIDIRGDLKGQILAKDGKDFFSKLLGLLALTMQMRNSQTGTDIDYLISPVKGPDGVFFDSRVAVGLPENADANGAYNIARKGLWTMEQIRKGEKKTKMTNAQWLEYAQTKR